MYNIIILTLAVRRYIHVVNNHCMRRGSIVPRPLGMRLAQRVIVICVCMIDCVSVNKFSD